MKRIAAVILSLFVLAGCFGGESEKDIGYKQVNAEQAMEIMANESDYIILDVRTEEEYAQAHIPNAICIPNETISDEKPKQLEDFDQLILVYCRSGNRSKQAAEKLVNIGYTNIVEFGGINDWHGEFEK